MDMENFAVQLQKTDDRSLRNEGRIKKLEEEHDIHTLQAINPAMMKLRAGRCDVEGRGTRWSPHEGAPTLCPILSADQDRDGRKGHLSK